MVIGIDYGSKMAGTTVIAYEEDEKVHLICSKKKQDADQMILDFVETHRPSLIGLDAPLSLPAVYTDPANHKDYFYRVCDKEVKAMSPMFLGGLTARAIKLKSQIGSKAQVIEVYPAMAAKLLNLIAFNCKKREADYHQMISKLTPWVNSPEIELANAHQFDALLALYISKKFQSGKANLVGLKREGTIVY